MIFTIPENAWNIMESPCFCMFLIIFGWSRLTKHHVCLASKSQQPIATQAAPAVPAVPGNCPAEEDNAVCLDFFVPCVGYIAMYWVVLRYIGILWITVMVCECLQYFLMILIVSDGLWWLDMAGTCMIMYENVRYVMGGAQTVAGRTISTTFHLLKFTFGFFPQSLKLHGVAMFWMFWLILNDQDC